MGGALFTIFGQSILLCALFGRDLLQLRLRRRQLSGVGLAQLGCFRSGDGIQRALFGCRFSSDF